MDGNYSSIIILDIVFFEDLCKFYAHKKDFSVSFDRLPIAYPSVQSVSDGLFDHSIF